MSEPLCLESRKAIGLAGLDKEPSFCRLCAFGPCDKLRAAKYQESRDAEAAARARVVGSAAKVGKILAELQATLDKLREATEADGGKGAA
jgi:hypothetical protein